MRLFTAIELTPQVRAAIAAEQQSIRSRLGEGARDVRWVRPEHLHVTLTFMPSVAEPQAVSIVQAFETGIDQQPFRLVFEGSGTFPERGAPRVLWLGITDGAAPAEALRNHIARQLASAGLAFDEKPFNPHLTLGRFRDGRQSDARRVASAGSKTVATMTVEAVTLFESRLSSSGPSYTPLARAALR